MTIRAGRRHARGAGGSPQALAEFRRLVEPLGRTVTGVPLTKVLHLKSAVTAQVGGHRAPGRQHHRLYTVGRRSRFHPHFRPMPEEGGSHVVNLGHDQLLMTSSAPRSAQLIADLGYRPVIVDIGEFEKLEGCVTCLSVRLRISD